jgi:bifunctional non-homologous end joining protein LigD
MAATRALTRYRRRRDFRRTPEPRGSRGDGSGDRPVFVVQLHDASTLHFDFRLEADGVLKSWAVPKGPSTDPGDKRLATPTEDHPLAYRSFEGVIPEGQYGAGTVIVWDEGSFRNLTTDRAGHEIPLAEALAHGHASFRLNGRKLRGAWSLTRFRGGSDGERESWLLVRQGHQNRASASRPANPRRARSVRTGHTLAQTQREAA